MLDMLKSMVATVATPPRKPPSPGYTPSGKAAAPRPKPAPNPASASAPRPGTATQEVVQWGKLGHTIHDTHARTGEALTLLHDLTAPPASESPSQITEILEALTAVLESQRRQEQRMDQMEQQLGRLLNIMRPRAA